MFRKSTASAALALAIALNLAPAAPAVAQEPVGPARSFTASLPSGVVVAVVFSRSTSPYTHMIRVADPRQPDGYYQIAWRNACGGSASYSNGFYHWDGSSSTRSITLLTSRSHLRGWMQMIECGNGVQNDDPISQEHAVSALHRWVQERS